MCRFWKWVTGSSRAGAASSLPPNNFRPALESLDGRVMPSGTLVYYNTVFSLDGIEGESKDDTHPNTVEFGWYTSGW